MTMLEIDNAEEALIWEQGLEIVERYYNLSKQFPKEELYSLPSQIKHSALLVLKRNFKYERKMAAEYIKYFRQALSLIVELENYLILAVKTRLCTQSAVSPVLDLSHKLRQTIIFSINKIN